MRLWLHDLLDRIDALSLRERVLVLAALLAIIAMLWDSLLMHPVETRRKRLAPEVANLRQEVDRLNRTIEDLASKGRADPDTALKDELRQARTGIADLDQQLGGLTKGLIAPEEMVQVLKQVLDHTAPLKLVALRTLPAEPLAALVPGEVLPSQIFRHGVEIELTGNYLDVVAFLRKVDQMPWRFYWQTLELDVEEHPRLKVKITAYTLGEEEAWIGA